MQHFSSADQNEVSNNSEPSKLDFHLETRHDMLPSGKEPIWITVEELNIEQLEPFLKLQTRGYEGDTIVISRLNLSIYRELCKKMNWKFAKVKDIIGTECKCLVIFGLSSHQNLEELMSRARNRLIIITEERRFVSCFLHVLTFFSKSG